MFSKDLAFYCSVNYYVEMLTQSSPQLGSASTASEITSQIADFRERLRAIPYVQYFFQYRSCNV